MGGQDCWVPLCGQVTWWAPALPWGTSATRCVAGWGAGTVGGCSCLVRIERLPALGVSGVQVARPCPPHSRQALNAGQA